MENKDYMKVIYMVFTLLLIMVLANAFTVTVCDFRWPDIGLAGDMK